MWVKVEVVWWLVLRQNKFHYLLCPHSRERVFVVITEEFRQSESPFRCARRESVIRSHNLGLYAKLNTCILKRMFNRWRAL